MRITLKQLQIFEAIARTGQVAKAAEMINLSAPATSMALAELERQLDSRLFERSGNRLLLNSQGSALLPMASQVLQQIADIESAFASPSTMLAGSLNVSASNTIGNFLLTKAAVAFSQQHTEARVELTIDNTRNVVQQVAEFRAELGFVEGYCLDSRIVTTPWHHDQLRIFCHPAHPLAGKTVSPAQLQGTSWVLREEGSGTREYFVNNANKLDLHPEVKFCFPTPDAIKQAVKQGAGLGVLSELAIEREITRRELGVVNVSGLDLSRPFYLIRHKHHSFTPLASAFINFCNDFLQLQHQTEAS
ncbi:LysR family transcriptional regulator [Shewanella yunxiaonensis]|uniref:LysR family transcriptional regulator n=1 Tax=Shewanella yunxiaonensis TaxID=2829809 RepID=A0ABX7YNZ5_9GAMM|nr:MULTISPECIES: LysR substrate-binding domain-containing protein [Shewanella]MDF0535895.1 LysR substrate-binding domain-containing protein [Shewanella sp. A32]QUN04482.1 LysR family transcriptional regulator [Shewanella yunxiaonensis]